MRGAVALTLYREALRSCRRLETRARPDQAPAVGMLTRALAERFVAAESPCCARVLKSVVEAGVPLTARRFVRLAFREQTDTRGDDAASALDGGFRCLRMLGSLEAWVIGEGHDEERCESFEHLLAREAPPQPPHSFVAAAILRAAR